MKLTSPAFTDGARLPTRFVLDGENLSPPLTWTGLPEESKSLAILCDDPDAPGGTWHHWALFNLSAERNELPEGFSRSEAASKASEAVNDFKRSGYDGPAPPPGHGTHHYHFRLLALDVQRLALDREADCRAVAAAAEPHVLASAELIGTFSR